MSKLSVVIPAYNEEQGIADIVQRVMAVREAVLGIGLDDMELLVVDDGSRDRTAEIVRDIAKNTPGVRLISHKINRGYGGALKTGFSEARGELIGFLDADGTYPPEFFPQLCKEAMNGVDLVIGSRMAGADSKMPVTRRVGNLFFASLLSIMGWERVTDSASGMRVFKRNILEQMYPLPDGLNLTPVMSTRAIHEGIKMSEVPIPYSERVGRSKLNIIKDGMLFLNSMLWTVLTYNPARIFGFVGLAGMIIALMIAVGLIASRLRGITDIGPWGVAALFSALVIGVGGVSFFSFGAASNYLVSLFYRYPIRQGLLGKSFFKTPLEFHFGWFGIIISLIAFGLGVISVLLGVVNGWEISRLWLYMLGSATLTLVGMQFITFWALIRILAQLSQRELLTNKDLRNLN